MISIVVVFVTTFFVVLPVVASLVFAREIRRLTPDIEEPLDDEELMREYEQR